MMPYVETDCRIGATKATISDGEAAHDLCQPLAVMCTHDDGLTPRTWDRKRLVNTARRGEPPSAPRTPDIVGTSCSSCTGDPEFDISRPCPASACATWSRCVFFFWTMRTWTSPPPFACYGTQARIIDPDAPGTAHPAMGLKKVHTMASSGSSGLRAKGGGWRRRRRGNPKKRTFFFSKGKILADQ